LNKPVLERYIKPHYFESAESSREDDSFTAKGSSSENVLTFILNARQQKMLRAH
jgi:hypothetical protein